MFGCGTSDAVVGVLDGRRGGVGGGRGGGRGRRGGAAHVLAPHAHGTPAPGLAPQEFLQLVHRGILSSYRRQSPELHGRTPALSLLLVVERRECWLTARRLDLHSLRDTVQGTSGSLVIVCEPTTNKSHSNMSLENLHSLD